MKIQPAQQTAQTKRTSPRPYDKQGKPFPRILKNCQEITHHLIRTYNRPLDYNYHVYFYRGYRCVLRLVSATDLIEDDRNLTFKARVKRYTKLDPRTQLPLIIWENGLIDDGHHRKLAGIAQGKTHFWCYVIERTATPFKWSKTLERYSKRITQRRIATEQKTKAKSRAAK